MAFVSAQRIHHCKHMLRCGDSILFFSSKIKSQRIQWMVIFCVAILRFDWKKFHDDFFFVHLQSSCIQKSSLLQIHLGYEFSFHFDIVFVCDRKRWKETNEKYIELRSAKFYEAKNKVEFLRSGVRFVQLIDIFNTNR